MSTFTPYNAMTILLESLIACALFTLFVFLMARNSIKDYQP